MTNIYVGNLPYRVSAEDLAVLFASFGVVLKTNIVCDPTTGCSRGFGFVQMDDPAAAERAIASLLKQPYHGRLLTINIARPRGSGRGEMQRTGNRSAAIARAATTASNAWDPAGRHTTPMVLPALPGRHVGAADKESAAPEMASGGSVGYRNRLRSGEACRGAAMER